MAKHTGLGGTLDLEKLRLSDVDENVFASPRQEESTPGNATKSPALQSQQKPLARPQSKHDMQAAREAQLKAELERIREVNAVIEGVTASLKKAKENMNTVHSTVNNASTLLGTWTRILSQTEHNQRLILNPQWKGATQDLEDLENEDIRRQHEAQQRAADEQRKREEAQRRAEEEERQRAIAAATPTSGRGVSRTRSVRGASSSTRGSAASRGRGTTGTTRGASASSHTRTASVRGRGRGLG
jgi:hypothetical protein